MDQFLSKLNLQNLLRQFCCGVIFFIPSYLFTPYSIRGAMWEAGVEESSITCVAILSFCIGTFIYHWEKNLYSYPIQLLHEKCGKLYVLILMILGIFFCACVYSQWLMMTCVILMLFGLAWLVGIYVLIFGEALIKCTEECWEIEGGAEGVTKAQQAIAQKVSVWADFVHCVQSSCFAWILGTAFAYYLHQMQSGSNLVCVHEMKVGVIIAISVLLVEIAIDAHRYIHVKGMSKISYPGNLQLAFIDDTPYKVESASRYAKDPRFCQMDISKSKLDKAIHDKSNYYFYYHHGANDTFADQNGDTYLYSVIYSYSAKALLSCFQKKYDTQTGKYKFYLEYRTGKIYKSYGSKEPVVELKRTVGAIDLKKFRLRYVKLIQNRNHE